jgi:hypothetical protein
MNTFAKGDQVQWNWAGGTLATVKGFDDGKVVIEHHSKANGKMQGGRVLRAVVFSSSLKLVNKAVK